MDTSEKSYRYCMCSNPQCPVCKGHDCEGEGKSPDSTCARCYNWQQRFDTREAQALDKRF